MPGHHEPHRHGHRADEHLSLPPRHRRADRSAHARPCSRNAFLEKHRPSKNVPRRRRLTRAARGTSVRDAKTRRNRPAITPARADERASLDEDRSRLPETDPDNLRLKRLRASAFWASVAPLSRLRIPSSRSSCSLTPERAHRLQNQRKPRISRYGCVVVDNFDLVRKKPAFARHREQTKHMRNAQTSFFSRQR